MKKKINIIFVALMGILLMMNSCKKSSSTFSVIPKDAKAVLVLDVKAIFDKADLKNIGDYSFYNTAMNEIENESSEGADIIKDLFTNPVSTGINLLDDAFVFYTNNGNDEQFIVYALPLSKKDKFETWLESVFDAADQDFDVESGDGYSYISIADITTIAWNKGSVIFVTSKGYSSKSDIEDAVEDFMTLEKDKQISENKSFMDFYSNKKDISLWMNYSALNDFNDDYADMQKNMNIDLDDASLSMYLDFLDGSINFSTSVDMGDNDNVFSKILDTKFNKDLLNYASDKSLGVMSYAINTEALLDYLKSIPEFDDANDGLKKQIDYTIEDLINSFGGSFLINLSGLDTKEVEYTDYDFDYNTYQYTEITKTKDQLIPQGIFAFDLKNADVFDELIDKFGDTDMLNDEGDYYSIEEDGMTFYFGYNDDVFVFSLDEDAMKAFEDGGYSDNLASNDAAGDIKDNSYYLRLNLNLDDYPSAVTDKILGDNDDFQDFVQYWNDAFDYLDIKSTGDNKGEMNIVFKNDDQNSLSYILHTIDDISKKFL